jgi:hypothetical protein
LKDKNILQKEAAGRSKTYELKRWIAGSRPYER